MALQMARIAALCVHMVLVREAVGPPAGEQNTGGTAGDICNQDGSDYSYTESIVGTIRLVVTNHCPNHPYYNLNPNTAVKKSTSYKIPSNPIFVGTATASSISSAHIDLSEKGAAVGVFFNAAQLYSPYGGPTYGKTTSWETGATYAEGNTFDQCGCHASSTTSPSYHCHVPPSCLLKQLGQAETSHSPQIGWAFDGFPVYGPRGLGGVMMQTCTQTGGTYGTDVCTDDCGGYYKDDGVLDKFTYRYYMQGGYNDGTSCANPGCQSPLKQYHPNSMMCFRGCCPSGQTCHSSISACPSTGFSDGYKSDYVAAVPVVNSLSVANGLPKNSNTCACGSLSVAVCADTSQDWKESTSKGGGSNNCPAAGTTTQASASGTTVASSGTTVASNSPGTTQASSSGTTLASSGTPVASSGTTVASNSQGTNQASALVSGVASIGGRVLPSILTISVAFAGSF